MATLYEIDSAIMALIDDETGEITDPDALDALQLERDEKIENIALWIKNLTADAAAYKAEKQSFEEKQRKAEKKAESLKNYLATALNGAAFKTSRVQVSFRRSESVNITDMSLLPDEFIKVAEPTADKAAIKAAIKEGKEFAGAELVCKTSLQVK